MYAKKESTLTTQSAGLFPNQFVDVVGITQDDSYHLLRHIGSGVIVYKIQSAVRAFRLRVEHAHSRQDAIGLEARHHHRALFHSFRPFVSLTNVESPKI